MRGLVVAGPADAASVAAALALWIFETAGLEPGFDLERAPLGFGVRTRPVPTKRKILGGTAPPPPFVVDRSARLEPSATTGLLLLKGAVMGGDDDRLAASLNEEALVVCDASVKGRVAQIRARTAFFGLDGDDAAVRATPTWLGALAPPDRASGALSFDLYAAGSYGGRFALRAATAASMDPRDLVRSAVAAIAITAEGFGVDIERARRALASFGGERSS